MRNVFYLLVINLIVNPVSAQDLINPYIPYTANNHPSMVSIGNPLYVQTDQAPYILFHNQTYYNGEYEISMEENYWYNFINNTLPVNQCSSSGVLNFSFRLALVSFPFVNECAYTNNACSQTPVRELTMPNELSGHFTYNVADSGWYYNSNPTILMNSSGMVKFASCGYSGGQSGGGSPVANTLVTSCYHGSQLNTPYRRAIPHSVIKHTVYAHCDYPPNENNIIGQFSFYYDNSRGRMRYYPFFATNAVQAGPENYDVIFYPMLIKNQNEIDLPSQTLYLGYDESVYDNHIVISDGGINYFKHSEINPTSACVSNPSFAVPVEIGSLFNVWTPNAVNPSFYYPCYSYISAPLRSAEGNYLAGYEKNQQNQIVTKPGIRHSYFIDQNTDLNIINPTEKEIYNPSEATITASNFVFPQDYTFKTIRGVYPNEAEALASRIAENGCDANTDLRNVPVKTDLTTENTTDAINFPLSALPATQHLYASRYYLENNSKLTVQNCVRLFDCTFDVKQGATLQFDDYPAHYGKEDHSFDRANTRFKIQTLGGAVLRNYNDVQYLQNGDITQTLPLHYKAIREIYAGSNVDPDQDIPKQDYVAQSGSNITLQAGEVIYLKEGFHAMSGSNVYITPTSPGGSAGPCNLPMAARMAGNRQQQQPSKNVALSGLGIYPNPASTVIKLHNNFMPLKAASVVIMDVYGRTVYEQTNFNSMLHAPDFSHKPSGMYMAKVTHHGTTETLKFMVQH